MTNAQLITKFNMQFPVGTLCPMRSIAKDGVPFEEVEVRDEAFDMNGQPMAFFVGKSGAYSIRPEFVDYK